MSISEDQLYFVLISPNVIRSSVTKHSCTTSDSTLTIIYYKMANVTTNFDLQQRLSGNTSSSDGRNRSHSSYCVIKKHRRRRENNTSIMLYCTICLRVYIPV